MARQGDRRGHFISFPAKSGGHRSAQPFDFDENFIHSSRLMERGSHCLNDSGRSYLLSRSTISLTAWLNPTTAVLATIKKPMLSSVIWGIATIGPTFR